MAGSRTRFMALSEITISRRLPENNAPVCTPLLAMETPLSHLRDIPS